jgi:hypothetical protein
MDAIEKHCSYKLMTIATHLLVHLPDQVALHGPLMEMMMFALESAFGMNKRYKVRPSHLVASMTGAIARQGMMFKMLAMMATLANDRVVSLETTSLLSIGSMRTIEPQGPPRDYVLNNIEAAKLLWWMRDTFPEVRALHDAYDKHIDTNVTEVVKTFKKKKKALPRRIQLDVDAADVPKTVETAMVWMGRPLTPKEVYMLEAPRQCSTYVRCNIGRELYRVREVEGHMVHRRSGIKMTNVKDGKGYEHDYWGELVSILEVSLEYGMGKHIVFEGDWFDNAHVTPKDRSKIWYCNPGHRDNARPYASANTIAGQPCYAPHPHLQDTWVVLDRTGDFLECLLPDGTQRRKRTRAHVAELRRQAREDVRVLDAERGAAFNTALAREPEPEVSDDEGGEDEPDMDSADEAWDEDEVVAEL